MGDREKLLKTPLHPPTYFRCVRPLHSSRILAMYLAPTSVIWLLYKLREKAQP